MERALKIIKDKYGEKMAHFCRENFATILNNDSLLLPVLLQELFAVNRELYNDLVNEQLEYQFVEYIYGFVSRYQKQRMQVSLTPEELLRTVGYTLYECQTLEDIMRFKEYYAPGEELCTFKGNRLNYWYVYFAVHDDADKLERSDFHEPERQDKYGTSVISIQFLKTDTRILSIKNRYNHTVVNPDATFANNLDNIVPGLTMAFGKYKGMDSSENRLLLFDIPGYVLASDGKYYKYNLEINNIYYCPNNIIIDNYEVKEFPKEKYIIIDYVIINLQDKTISLYDQMIDDELSEVVGLISNILILKGKNGKKIMITNDQDKKIVINISNLNQIISVNKSSEIRKTKKRG